MEVALKSIRENDSSPPEPLIAKIVPSELDILEGRYINLDELNYLAKRMESFSDDELINLGVYAAICYAVTIVRGMKKLPEKRAGQTGCRENGGRSKTGKTPATKIQEEED